MKREDGNDVKKIGFSIVVILLALILVSGIVYFIGESDEEYEEVVQYGELYPIDNNEFSEEK